MNAPASLVRALFALSLLPVAGFAAGAPPPDSAADHAASHAERSNVAFYPPRFVLSQEGQALVQKDGKYLPLTAAVVQEQRAKLE